MVRTVPSSALSEETEAPGLGAHPCHTELAGDRVCRAGSPPREKLAPPRAGPPSRGTLPQRTIYRVPCPQFTVNTFV